MGHTTISITGLSQKEIKSAMKQLRMYQQETSEKIVRFAWRLADIGVSFAENNAGYFGKYITFGRTVTAEKTGATAIVYAINKQLIVREWKLADDTIKTAEISPILMAEFGSGAKANNPDAGKFGMGRGTFPGQTHAFEEEWWWMTVDGEWKHSSSVSADMPMSQACSEMIANVRKIAKEVFG